MPSQMARPRHRRAQQRDERDGENEENDDCDCQAHSHQLPARSAAKRTTLRDAEPPEDGQARTRNDADVAAVDVPPAPRATTLRR